MQSALAQFVVADFRDDAPARHKVQMGKCWGTCQLCCGCRAGLACARQDLLCVALFRVSQSNPVRMRASVELTEVYGKAANVFATAVAAVDVDDSFARSGIFRTYATVKQTPSYTSSHGTSVTGRGRSINKWISRHVPRAWPIAPVTALQHLYLYDDPLSSFLRPHIKQYQEKRPKGTPRIPTVQAPTSSSTIARS